MQVLADEYRNRNLRVNCINPRGTSSKMRAATFPHEDSNKLKTSADIMPLYLYLMRMTAVSNRYDFRCPTASQTGCHRIIKVQ